MRNTQHEEISSGLPPRTDIGRPFLVSLRSIELRGSIVMELMASISSAAPLREREAAPGVRATI
jgi:hypothetical protein